MSKADRKINYYKVGLKKSGDISRHLNEVLIKIEEFKEDNSSKRRYSNPTGPDIEFSTLSLKGDFYNIKAVAIRDEFPEVISKTDGSTEILEQEEDETKGIPNNTHIVIYVGRKVEQPIIAIESTQKGPRIKDIGFFFNRVLINLGIKGNEFSFEPVFAFQLETLQERIGNEIAQFKMLVHKDDIADIMAYDDETGKLLKHSSEYAESEYIYLNFKIDFKRTKNPFPREGLASRVRSVINILLNKPQSKNHFRKLDLWARDHQSGNQLRLFDLLEQKVASVVKAERKRPRSQDYNSSQLYEAIRQKIVEEFRL